MKLTLNKFKKYNVSVLIALIAVLISSASTFISLEETKILREQQEIMISQKEASVWPYMENSYTLNIINDSSYEIEFSSINKGVGPAIINSVQYEFKGVQFNNWEFSKVLKELYPNLIIKNKGNTELNNIVLTVGEKVVTFRILINNTNYYESSAFNILINQIAQDLHLKYCYCSVYGNCWKVDGEEIGRSTKCTFRDEIR